MADQTFSPQGGIPHVQSESQHSDWQHGVDTTALAVALMDFETQLPGWGHSLGLCHKTADCTIFPDAKGQDAHLLKHRVFDDGFHVSIYDGTLAEALRWCMAEADKARRAVQDHDSEEAC